MVCENPRNQRAISFKGWEWEKEEGRASGHKLRTSADFKSSLLFEVRTIALGELLKNST